jgi:hypothetical protein
MEYKIPFILKVYTLDQYGRTKLEWEKPFDKEDEAIKGFNKLEVSIESKFRSQTPDTEIGYYVVLENDVKRIIDKEFYVKDYQQHESIS